MAGTTDQGLDGATYYSGPLQLIRIDDDGSCHLEENAVCILNQIQGRLAVVGIAGLYRTGKSFLLNRLLGLQEGFELGPTVNPCTKGLWIWGQPVQLAPDYHCILIDSEGLGSSQRTASCDMQIFSLCILLSSYFIYNSMGAIDQQAIDDLHLVCHLAKNVHVKARKGVEAERASELSQYFPNLLWVLRDFHLRLVDSKGSSVSESDYLENALRPLPGQDDKNKVREVIKDLFKDRDCVTMVRPVAEESDLRNIQKVPYESLRPQFRTQVEAFVRKVYMTLKPKKIDGSFVSGTMFVKLATEYCKAINNSAVPTIQSAWTSVIQHQLRLCLKDAVQLYRARMNDTAMQHLPMNEDRLRELHKAAKAEAMKVFLAPKLESNDAKFREFRTELSARLKQLMDHVKAENLSTSQRQCQRFAQELYSKQIENKLSVKGSYKSFVELQEDWEQLQKSYFRQTAGPAQPEVLATWLMPRVLESAHKLWDELKLTGEERHASLQRKLAEAEARSLHARDDLDDQRSKQSDNLEVLRRQWLTERLELEKSLDEAKRNYEETSRKASREKAQLVDSERTLREQMKILQERLSASGSGISSEFRRPGSGHPEGFSSTSADIRGLQDSITAMMTEYRSLGLERGQLEMKAEHEKQLIGLERKFQRQLMEARRKNEGLIENLRQTYEDEVDNLKAHRTELIGRNKDLERELEKARGNAEVLSQRLSAADTEKTLQQKFVDNAQRQAELVAAVLERLPGRGGSSMRPLREELNTITGTTAAAAAAATAPSRENTTSLPIAGPPTSSGLSMSMSLSTSRSRDGGELPDITGSLGMDSSPWPTLIVDPIDVPDPIIPRADSSTGDLPP